MVMGVELMCTAHVVCMDEDRIPEALFCYELVKRCRNQGGQKKRFKEWFKYNLKKCYVNTETWEIVAKITASTKLYCGSATLRKWQAPHLE